MSASASCSAISRRWKAAMKGSPSVSRRHAHQDRRRGGERNPPSHVRAAICAARPRRPDGRLGLDAGAAVRRGLRHPETTGRLFWSASPPRSAPASAWVSPRPFRRRLAHRTRLALPARRRLRADDDARRPRPHPALSRARHAARSFSDRDDHRRRSWCFSNSGRSPMSARATWTRPSSRRCSRSCSAAPSCSPSACLIGGA